MIKDILLHLGRGLAGLVAEDPGLHARRAVLAAATGAIVYNAAFAQEARHAAPWFEDQLVAAAQDVAPRRAAPADPVVFGLQSELMELGYYEGSIDGVTGARTRAAIRAYEAAHGLPESGRPTGALLARIRVANARDLPRPLIDARRDVSTGSIERGGDRTASRREGRIGAPDRGLGTAAPAGEADPIAMLVVRVRSVQEALRRHGYDISADGAMGPRTRGAIEGYQAERGLRVTGEIDDRLLSDMSEAGLLRR